MSWSLISFAISYAGGIATSILGQVLYNFLRSVLPSYFSQQLYKQITIQGDWIIKHEGNPLDGEGLESKWMLKAKIEQIGQKISGNAHAACMSGASVGKNVFYKLEGRVVNSLLDATFVDKSEDARNRSTFLLQLQGDGRCLEGYRLFLGRNKNAIRAVQCQWERPEGTSPCSSG